MKHRRARASIAALALLAVGTALSCGAQRPTPTQGTAVADSASASESSPSASHSVHALVDMGNYGAIGALSQLFGSQSAVPFDQDAETPIGSMSGIGSGNVVAPPKDSIHDQPNVATGNLPPEVIQRIVRANFPRFRACFEAGLKASPSLKGIVAVRFVIDETGAVQSASIDAGKTTLADVGVQSCVKGVYVTLSFPEPEGGSVTVTYPIDFQPE